MVFHEYIIKHIIFNNTTYYVINFIDNKLTQLDMKMFHKVYIV